MSGSLRFGRFELDPKAGELRQAGDLVKLSPQPFKVLAFLVQRSGDVVSRHEIRQQIWSDQTFVDFDQGLNFCIRQIREALGDTAVSPEYIETLPRRGYRFLMPVEAAPSSVAAAITRLMVLPFRVLRPDPETDFLAFSLPDALTSSLSGLESLVVRSSLVAARFSSDLADPRHLAEDADVDVVLTGTLLRAGDRVRVSSQLTEVPGGTLAWSHATEMDVGHAFQVQDELARRLIDSLSLPLTARERGMISRDVPRSGRAYDLFLRGNQLSYDSKQWRVARDLYEKCLAEDPYFAPAWARLGRIHHVTAKYLDSGTHEGLAHAEQAFRRALELNPDLPIAHKLYAQLEVDLGRAPDAMARLLGRARSADPELFAGLVSACRYCGLLDASIAADRRARQLEPHVRTSVPHSWFMQGDYERVVSIKIDEYPYIVPMSLAAVGRTAEAVERLRELEARTHTRLRDFIVAARTLLEGDRPASMAAVGRIAASAFRDPEGLFYLARHLAHLGESEGALKLLHRVVAGGFYGYPTMKQDPWLDPVRNEPAFSDLLRQARQRHEEAASTFVQLGGAALLG